MGVRQGRIKAPGQPACAYYHCTSRVVDRRFALGEEQKNEFLKLMREYEAFCGVFIATFCIMDNHFHLLLKVPKPPEKPLTDEELLTRIEALSGTGGSKATRQQLTWFRERNQHDPAEALRRRFLARMWDLSAFMKLLKQRFTQWYNRQHQRDGTLWEARFKSVLVESEGEVLAVMAAYIDLNSVRAGLEEDPLNYRWCGYGQAMAGHAGAQEGLREVIAGAQRVPVENLSMTEAMREYRLWLFKQGEQTEGTDAEGRPLRKGFSQEAVLEVIRQRGRVPAADYVKLRVRYFVDGVVLGTRKYVDEVFGAYRSRFGKKRKDGARRMRGVDSENLYALRDLKRDVIGVVEKAFTPRETTVGGGSPLGP